LLQGSRRADAGYGFGVIKYDPVEENRPTAGLKELVKLQSEPLTDKAREIAATNTTLRI
jgi:hypothetical protein